MTIEPRPRADSARSLWRTTSWYQEGKSSDCEGRAKAGRENSCSARRYCYGFAIAESLDILFAAESLAPPAGGAERFWVEIMDRLARRHRVRALTFSRPGPGLAAPA